MGKTNIEWAHYTVNAWTGCSKISPACKNCYAEHDTPVRVVEHQLAKQLDTPIVGLKIRLPMWGGHDKRTGEGYRVETVGWEKRLRALNRKAHSNRVDHNNRALRLPAGTPSPFGRYERPRVFINSLSDTFESFEGPIYRKQNGRFEIVANSLDDVRRRLFAVIEECTELDVLLLTKRPENVYNMVPNSWRCNWRPWVWLGTTVENQELAAERIPELLRIPARVRFLSMEPLLGEVDLERHLWQKWEPSRGPIRNSSGDVVPMSSTGHIHWVIVGGESGPNARPMHPNDARKIRDQCQAAGVPFFFKQWGEHGPRREAVNMSPPYRFEERVARVGKTNAGRLLDGREWNEVPK